jgi:putative hydrolase of the HAD superfamily
MNAPRGRPLVEIETWIFDLDNTLYPASCRLFDQIHARMTEFIAERLGIAPEAALAVQKTYFREHGTTMRGLMTVNRIDPGDFLAYVHEVDLACVPPDPVLVNALMKLPGRKIVHTNGSQRQCRAAARSPRHCRLVLCCRRHRRRRVRPEAGARRLPRIAAAPRCEP